MARDKLAEKSGLCQKAASRPADRRRHSAGRWFKRGLAGYVWTTRFIEGILGKGQLNRFPEGAGVGQFDLCREPRAFANRD